MGRPRKSDLAAALVNSGLALTEMGRHEEAVARFDRLLARHPGLVAAHGNSLRALVMVLDGLTPQTIPTMELATGVPLVYRLKADSTVASKDVLTA